MSPGDTAKHSWRSWAFGFALVCTLLSPSAVEAHSPKHPAQRLYEFSHAAMSTTFKLYLYSADAKQASTASGEAFDEIDRIEQLLSNYRESSELSRINQSAAAAPITTDAEMMSFLTQAAYWSSVSDGAFDLTVGRLMKAWGFYRHQGRVPPAAELQSLRSSTGWQKVELNTANHTVQFTAAGVELDPGGIGKGFAVDAAVRILKDDGVQAALLSAGSSTLYAMGAPPHRNGWRVVVPGPLPLHRKLSTIILHNESLSSADCTQKNFIVDGHRYCHIMDPRTMQPVEGRVQVSIVHPSATASDALSNVLFVQTPQQSLQTLAAYAPQARALIVSVSKKHAVCSAFRWNAAVDSTHCSRSPVTIPPQMH
jgi:thiamine biosynthesis lipoprotein